MRAVDIIELKRDGKEIPGDVLRAFVQDAADEKIPDYQIAAFLMAVYFKGMQAGELATYTDAMIHSGDVMDLPGLGKRFKVDKHSTGGVGDKVSISLAPMVIACTAGGTDPSPVIPMISGRGLGHTGGTLDKLESIEGYRVDLSNEEIEKAIGKCGYVITGQTGRLVPADKKFYALRDVTATVPSLDLISASIMSKKLASCLDALVLDVKVGSGAFMKDIESARRLADTMIAIGKSMGCNTQAVLTSMEQPLGRQVGNANEMREAIAMLRGEAENDYAEICYALGTRMLMMALGIDEKQASEKLRQCTQDGSALEVMRRNIEAQGGNPKVVDDEKLLRVSEEIHVVKATKSGYVGSYVCNEVGRACCILGGGRNAAGDAVDHSVGIEVLHKIGDEIREGDDLFIVRHNNGRGLESCCDVLRRSLAVVEEKPAPNQLISDIRS